MSSEGIIANMLGTGLVCLDIILGERKIRYYNGGSCGNVTAAFSFLGQKSSVITRCYLDRAGHLLNANLNRIGVKQITFGNTAPPTPRIIEKLDINYSGYVGHKFLLSCPQCGQNLPKVKLLDKSNLSNLMNSLNEFDVFYTDRSSPGIRNLRSYLRDIGVWTVYEPNSARNIKSVFMNAFESDIAKFSAEKFSFTIVDNLKQRAGNSRITLLIYTKGKNGLSFCYRKRDRKLSKWINLNPQPAPRLLDTSGAGDWCTAGMLTSLLGKYRKHRYYITKDDVISALQYGQALAAISCAFIGGQGLIHADFDQQDVRDLLQPFKKTNLIKIPPTDVKEKAIIETCPLCLCSI